MPDQHTDDPEVVAPRYPSEGPLDIALATPALFAALAKAQLEVETVGKDATNEQRKYNYASAEAMLRGARGPLGANGLAFFSTWCRNEIPTDPGGSIGNQFVCATVRMHWVLSHTSGGVIRGTCELDAIASPARPPDKAVAATLTYMRGFMLRDLLNLDRAEENPDEAVDQRDESNGWAPGGRQQRGQQQQQQQQRQAPRQAPAPREGERRSAPPAGQQGSQSKPAEGTPEHDAHIAMIAAAKDYLAAVQQAGTRPDLYGIAGEAVHPGKAWDPRSSHTLEQYAAGRKALERAAAELRGEADPHASDDVPTVCPACNRSNGEHAQGCPEAPRGDADGEPGNAAAGELEHDTEVDSEDPGVRPDDHGKPKGGKVSKRTVEREPGDDDPDSIGGES